MICSMCKQQGKKCVYKKDEVTYCLQKSEAVKGPVVQSADERKKIQTSEAVKGSVVQSASPKKNEARKQPVLQNTDQGWKTNEAVKSPLLGSTNENTEDMVMPNALAWAVEVERLREKLEVEKWKRAHQEEVVRRQGAEQKAERMKKEHREQEVELEAERKGHRQALQKVVDVKRDAHTRLKDEEKKRKAAMEAKQEELLKAEGNLRKQARVERAVAVRAEKERAKKHEEDVVARLKGEHKRRRDHWRDRALEPKRRKLAKHGEGGLDVVVLDGNTAEVVEVVDEAEAQGTKGVLMICQ